MFHEGETLDFESSASANSATPALEAWKYKATKEAQAASDLCRLCGALRLRCRHLTSGTARGPPPQHWSTFALIIAASIWFRCA